MIQGDRAVIVPGRDFWSSRQPKTLDSSSSTGSPADSATPSLPHHDFPFIRKKVPQPFPSSSCTPRSKNRIRSYQTERLLARSFLIRFWESPRTPLGPRLDTREQRKRAAIKASFAADFPSTPLASCLPSAFRSHPACPARPLRFGKVGKSLGSEVRMLDCSGLTLEDRVVVEDIRRGG